MKFKRVILLVFLAILSVGCNGYQWVYFHDEEIKGHVVDAETNEPIKGAIVVAQWALTQVPGEGFGGFAKIQVSITDSDGKFVIPSWKSIKPWKVMSVMHGLAPKIIIYKPGYSVYHSHRIEREGFPGDISKTAMKKKMIKDKYSLNPAKLKKIYTDDGILKGFSGFESRSDISIDYYSKKQITFILHSFEEAVNKFPIENNMSKQKILKEINEYRKHWLEAK